MLRRNGLLLFLIIALTSGLIAGTTGKLAGTVTDKENGEPLIGANISIEGTSLGAATDIDGTYFILNVPPGSYTIAVEYLGYQTTRVNAVQVSVDRTTRQDIKLSSEAIAFDDEIVVTADRDLLVKDLTSSEARVSAEKIEALPASSIDQILQIQAGVTRGSSGSFHIRGGRSSEIAYYVNGSSITDGYDNSRALNIENESIEELKVISGTFNAEYGNAMSGIINIVTKSGGTDFKAHFEAYTGDYLTDDKDLFFNIDDRSPIHNYSLQGSLSGPVPGTNEKVRFYTTARKNYVDGYLYGVKVFNDTGGVVPVELPEFSSEEEANEYFNSGRFIELFDGEPMNWRDNITSRTKLTWHATPTLKFDLEGAFGFEEYQDYNHDLRFLPNANVQKFNDAYSGSFTANHTLSNATFYTLNLSYLDKEFNEYLYEDPLDPRYRIPTDQIFGFGSSTNNHRFERRTKQALAKFDINSQVHPVHLVKLGFEVRSYDLFQDDFNLEFVNGEPGIPDLSAVNRDQFSVTPIQAAAYIQDKIEYESVIINAGLRFDYFDPQARILADPRDPDIYRPTKPEHLAMTFAEREAIWYKDATPKLQLSPRLGIAYQISADGQIHFSFGHFLQIPELRQLYQDASYKISYVSGASAPFGNPDLDAQQTVQYELGLQQELTDDLKVDVTGFYRDIRDWVTTGSEISTYLAGTRYSQFINKDYANIRGVTVQLVKRLTAGFGVDFVYQMQVAEGTNSNPDEEFLQQNSDFEPTIQLSPLDWDQTHNVSTVIYYSGDTWSASVLGRFNTGLPYTPAVNFNEDDIGPGATSDVAKNSLRKPNKLTVDLTASKNVTIGDVTFKLFASVFNVLDRRNVNNVYADTGTASSTFNTNPDFIEFFYLRPDWYDAPREVQLGFRVGL